MTSGIHFPVSSLFYMYINFVFVLYSFCIDLYSFFWYIITILNAGGSENDKANHD